MGNARVVVFLVAMATLALALGSHRFSVAWTAIPLLVFIGQVIVHDRIADALDKAARKAEFYQRGVRRLDDAWQGHGDTGQRYHADSHPYASDLDIFGDGSLYQLLGTCRSRAGADCLAQWLLAPADAETVAQRQAGVRELAPKRELREAIALDGERDAVSISPQGLSAWGEAEHFSVSTAARAFAVVLAVANIASLSYSIATHRVLLLFIALTATAVFQRRYGKWIAHSMETTGRASKALINFALLLRRIEEEPAETAILQQIQARLTTPDSGRASTHIEKFQTLTAFQEATSNLIFRPIARLILWQFQCAATIEAWRTAYGPHLREWLAASAEYEALTALADFAYENPEACYPVVEPGEPHLSATALAHPLLKRATRVGNPVSLGPNRKALIVSGSNMSGKSTLMRTLGVNVVLALAGAPVIAESMTLTPLQIGASIRTVDSLQDGVSRFYAEIKRIHQVVELTSEELPVLFLLDEILHGTNSHDRQIGAEAIVRSLVASGAIGLVTTHDLALARLADDASLAADNVHFEDQIVAGRVEFDYRLKPGVVEKSNAIALMRAVGLNV